MYIHQRNSFLFILMLMIIMTFRLCACFSIFSITQNKLQGIKLTKFDSQIGKKDKRMCHS